MTEDGPLRACCEGTKFVTRSVSEDYYRAVRTLTTTPKEALEHVEWILAMLLTTFMSLETFLYDDERRHPMIKYHFLPLHVGHIFCVSRQGMRDTFAQLIVGCTFGSDNTS